MSQIPEKLKLTEHKWSLTKILEIISSVKARSNRRPQASQVAAYSFNTLQLAIVDFSGFDAEIIPRIFVKDH